MWHIHGGKPPLSEKSGLSFGLLLNLASVCNAEDSTILWGFVTRYAPQANAQNMPFLNELIHYALAYYRDYIKPTKQYRPPSPADGEALLDLKTALEKLICSDAEIDITPDAIQSIIYTVGKRHNYPELRDWFATLYEVLLGQKEGPRMGSFITLYGIKEIIHLIEEKTQGFLPK